MSDSDDDAAWMDSDAYTWDGHGNAWHRYSTPDDEGEWQPVEMVPGVPDWVLHDPYNWPSETPPIDFSLSPSSAHRIESMLNNLVMVELPLSRWQRFKLWLHVRRNGGRL